MNASRAALLTCLQHRSFTLASQCTSAELNIALIVCCRTFLYTPLQNFMCHTRLTVELTRVNIIYGWGGCGKSAVMYGLYVCLLGTEAASPLGLTDFMKFDADGNTEITVKLLNTAQNAYKPDLFGPTITVKRVLLGKRRSSLLLISDSGHVVSRTEHEVSLQSQQLDSYHTLASIFLRRVHFVLHSCKCTHHAHNIKANASALAAIQHCTLLALMSLCSTLLLLQLHDSGCAYCSI
jgi:hypothetical protein